MRKFVFKVFIGLNALILSASIFAYEIVTPIPADYQPREIPMGYVRCYETKTGSYKGVWSGAHRVCQYQSTQDKEMWVAGYWQCYQFTTPQGICTSWKWVLPHWSTRGNVQFEPDPEVVTPRSWSRPGWRR